MFYSSVIELISKFGTELLIHQSSYVYNLLFEQKVEIFNINCITFWITKKNDEIGLLLIASDSNKNNNMIHQFNHITSMKNNIINQMIRVKTAHDVIFVA